MRGNGNKPLVHDGDDGALSIFLGLLHFFDVLLYAWVVGPPRGNGRVEGNDVPSLSDAAAGS